MILSITQQYWLWGILTVIFVLVEMFTTQLISIWFAVSSLINLFLVAMHINFKIQLIQFIIVGIILFILFKPISNRIATKYKYIPINANEVIIGGIGKIEKIDDNGIRVKANDNSWKAISNDKDLKIGDDVKIIGLNGVTLTVKKVNNANDIEEKEN